jgi:hypothetical protein
MGLLLMLGNPGITIVHILNHVVLVVVVMVVLVMVELFRYLRDPAHSPWAEFPGWGLRLGRVGL